MNNNDNTLTIIDNLGREILCNILMKFEHNQNTYLVYTDDLEKLNNNSDVMAGIYSPKNNQLLPITTNEEFDLIEKIIKDHLAGETNEFKS